MTPFFVMLAELDRAAHDSAFGRNLLPTPSEAQCQAGNYRVGRVNIHGLPVSIEQPRDSVRCGTDASGKAWRSRMAAHYGYINGTTGADGDHVDCFIGDWPISNTVWVINQHIDGKFDEHKVMLLFNREDMARAAYLDSYEPGWNGIGSMIKLTPTQLSFWLKSGDMSKPLTSDQLFNEGFHPMNTTDPTWDSGAHVARAWYDVERLASGMDVHELHEPLTVCDAIAGGQLLPRFDALVVTMGKAEAKLATMQSVLARNGGKLSVVGMQITDPFKQAGTTNIVAIYELSDGQTISIYLHNPDTTPNKLAPTDAMVAWKWLLNRRDVSVVVAPENGQELSPLTIGRRVMALAEKNSEAFVKANARRAEKLQALDALVGEVADLTTRKRQLQNELASLDVEIVDAVAKKQARGRAERADRQAQVGSKQNNQAWWENEDYMRKTGYSTLYMLGKSRGKEYVAMKKAAGGGYEVTMARAGMLFQMSGGKDEIIYWLREKLAGMGDGLLGRVLPMDSLVSMLKLVFGDDALFSVAQQGVGGGDGGDLSQTTEKPDLSYHRSADGLFTTFLPNTPEGENAWRTMNATQNSEGGKVLASHTEAVIQQIRDAGYTVSEDASAPVTADEVDAMVADLTGAGQGDGPTAAQQEPAANASAGDVQQPANGPEPEPVAALPNLVGNEKQVAWAKDIRSQVAINVDRALKLSERDITDHGDDLPDAFFQEVHELHKAQADKLMSNADAQFWIDSRVFAIGAQLADSHPSSSDTPLTMLSNWDRADRAVVIKALRAKYRAQQEAATAPEPAAAQTEPAPIVDQDPQATADRALFESIIDGTAPDLLSPELADQFDAAGERRADDPSMKDLFEQAVNAYQEAMLAATANISA